LFHCYYSKWIDVISDCVEKLKTFIYKENGTATAVVFMYWYLFQMIPW